MGYDHGITLQSVPYDFRKDINTNGVAKKILKSVRTLQNYTGKKVILIGHSYGNLNIWNFLTEEMSQVEKDEQIHSFLAISPPFLGSIKALQMHLGGNSDFAQ
jgi:predicted alpha/beta hydrolase family esterase